MKFVIVFAVFLAAALGHSEQGTEMFQAFEDCVKDHGVDMSLALEVHQGNVDKADDLGCVMVCTLQKVGIMNDKFEVDMDLARSKMPPDTPADEFERIATNCKDITGEGCEMGSKLLKCVMANKNPGS